MSRTLGNDNLLFIYKNIHEHIKMADNKIGVISAFYIANFGIYISNLKKLHGCLGNILIFLFLFFSLLFVLSIILALIPRTNAKRLLKNENYKSIIFFKDLAEIDVTRLDNMTDDDFLEDLKSQIIVNSKIASRKFLFITISYFLIMVLFIINTIIIHI